MLYGQLHIKTLSGRVKWASLDETYVIACLLLLSVSALIERRKRKEVSHGFFYDLLVSFIPYDLVMSPYYACYNQF